MAKSPGIPTKYRHRRYRSRIEARWANMFDLLDWKYEYEPYDLNGWIPDFILLAESEILVEVKFHTILSEFDTDKCLEAIRDTEKENKEILLVGCVLPVDYEMNICVGWLGEYSGDMVAGFDFAPFNHYGNNWGFIHLGGDWTDRMTGLYDGNHLLHLPDHDEVYELWQEAGNKVQWKKND